MTRAALALLAGAAATASADGTATWLWDVTTQNGDAIVEPGETATITLSLLMEPDDPEDYVAIAATIFDTLGDEGAAMGGILGWEVLNNLADLTGDLTTSDGVSLYNTNAGQLTVFTGPFTDDNPVDVLRFEWAPNRYTPFDVGYHTSSEYRGEQVALVWEGDDMDEIEAVTYPVIEANITFTVVPTPATAVLIALSCTPRRRRSP